MRISIWNFNVVFEPHVHTIVKLGFFLPFLRKLWAFFCIFRVFVTSLSLGPKKKQNPAFHCCFVHQHGVKNWHPNTLYWAGHSQSTSLAVTGLAQVVRLRTFALWSLRVGKRNSAGFCAMTMRKNALMAFYLKQQIVHFIMFVMIFSATWSSLMHEIYTGTVQNRPVVSFLYCRYAKPCQISFSNSQADNYGTGKQKTKHDFPSS